MINSSPNQTESNNGFPNAHTKRARSESNLYYHKEKEKFTYESTRGVATTVNNDKLIEMPQDMSQDFTEICSPNQRDRPNFVVINVYKQGTKSPGFQFSDLQKRVGNTSSQEPKYISGATNLFVQCIMLMSFMMFAFTGILVSYVLMTPDVKSSLVKNAFLAIALSAFTFLFIDYTFVCTHCSRRAPCHFNFLCITVASYSTFIATVSALIKSSVLLYAILSVSATILVGAILSFTKFNFAKHGTYVVMLSTAFAAIFLETLIVSLVNKTFDVTWLLILLITTFIQVSMLTIQLQTILNGKTIHVTDDDYALGAFMLYASIIDVFLKMMQISGETRDPD